MAISRISIALDLEKEASSDPNDTASTDRQAQCPNRTELADWDGPDDSGNPQNWSGWKKALHIFVPCMLGLTTTLGVSIFSVGIEDVSEHFHVSHVAATIPLTLYVLGQALGPCIAAPVSETYGRNAVFILTCPLTIAFTLGAGLSHSYASLCVTRFFAGVFGSPSLAVGGGVIADIMSPLGRSPVQALNILMALQGTSLGPIFGGYAVQHKGWRWTQWIFIFVTLVGWIPSFFTSETYKKIILARRAKRRGLQLSAAADNLPRGFFPSVKVFVTITLIRPWAMLLQEPIVFYLSLYVGVVFIVLFGFFDAFPVVFAGVYRFTLGETGLSFFGCLIGVTIGAAAYCVTDHIVYRQRTLRRRANGDMTRLPPEERLYLAMVGAPLISIGLFWFAWSSKASVHWISAEIATVVFAIGTYCVSSISLIYLLEVYGAQYGASATAANNLVRYLLGSASPLYTRQMCENVGIGWAMSLLAFITVALIPVPFVLFKYGEVIRGRSRYKPVVSRAA